MRTSTILVILATAAFGLSAARIRREPSDFSRTTIDLGVTVLDLDASAAFYGEGVGFKELEGFSVPAQFCSDAGLTEGEPLSIRVFVLGEGESATKIKLMQVEGVESKVGENAFIHSQVGFRYLTIYVSDTNATLKRLAAAGVTPLAKGPILIGEDPNGPYLTLVRDPDGNMIELIGPKL